MRQLLSSILCKYNKMNVEQFCEGFLHIEETPEIDMKQFCICNNLCTKKTVWGILILYDDTDTKIFSKIYKNSKIQNKIVHAEIMITQDQEVIKHLKNCHHILLYLTYNPCHFSGGHHGFIKQNSCTKALINFKELHLDPLNISFEVAISYPYRVHWKIKTNCCDIQTHFAPVCYTKTIQNARSGLLLLDQKNIHIRALKKCDYETLLEFCLPETRNVFISKKDSILEKRQTCDSFVKSVLKFYKKNEQGDMQCIFCSES